MKRAYMATCHKCGYEGKMDKKLNCYLCPKCRVVVQDTRVMVIMKEEELCSAAESAAALAFCLVIILSLTVQCSRQEKHLNDITSERIFSVDGAFYRCARLIN